MFVHKHGTEPNQHRLKKRTPSEVWSYVQEAVVEYQTPKCRQNYGDCLVLGWAVAIPVALLLLSLLRGGPPSVDANVYSGQSALHQQPWQLYMSEHVHPSPAASRLCHNADIQLLGWQFS